MHRTYDSVLLPALTCALDLIARRRDFLSQTAHVHRQTQYSELLDSMSERLKADAALCWAKDTLLRVSYFNKETMEEEFLASAALTLKSRVFCRTEFMPVESLFVIERGIAAKNGRIATKGASLGEDMVLNSMTFRDLDPAIALTFVVQIACLEKKSLESLLNDYPLARREIRSSSFKLAFCRAVLQLAKVVGQNRALGKNTTILEAFATIRRSKQKAVLDHARLREPSRRLLASNLIDLSERTEAIATESQNSRDELKEQMERRMGKLDSKLDSIKELLEAQAERKRAGHMKHRSKRHLGALAEPTTSTPERQFGSESRGNNGGADTATPKMAEYEA